MRLRLWWHLCVLDSRAPEDQGFQHTVDLGNWGLRLPLNVNDNQIYPDMTQVPVESDGWTEMSFFLIQTEACRKVHPILETQEIPPSEALIDIREKRKQIREPSQYMASKYGLSPGSRTSSDLSRIATQHVTTACKKMHFVLQLREEIIMRKQKEAQDAATPDVLRLSFKMACECLESSYVLLKGGFASRYRWFFSIYTQWYALTYVLRCLCSCPYGYGTERAWVLVEELLPQGLSLQGDSAGAYDEYGHGSIWRYLNRLRHQALTLRQHVGVPGVTADHIGGPSSSGGRRYSPQLLPEADIPHSTDTTATAHNISALPEMGQEFSAHLNEGVFSPVDVSMPEMALLPDWNAVINGCLNDGGYEINPSSFPHHRA